MDNSLITMYTICWCVEDAQQLFDETFERDLVSWSSMILGYSDNIHANEVLIIFKEMPLEGVEKDSITIMVVLPSYMQLESLRLGKEIHAFVIRRPFEINVFYNALIGMYAKCGRSETTHNLFANMCDRDIISWNVLITRYS